MQAIQPLHITTRKTWRTWLKKNHNTKKEIWLIFYKKHIDKPTLPHDEAVEEALCFGWIDSTVKRLDDEKYAQRYTPRNDNSVWAKSNIKRVKKMIKEGKMTKAGLEKINTAKKKGKWKEAKVREKAVIPNDLQKALKSNKKAWQNFTNLAKSYRIMYIHWVTSAKRKETRKRRIKRVVKLAEQGKKPGMV